jgi:glucosyl-3-phosphoglycerate synthase
MADFQQNVVPTFTRLVDENLDRMEKSILRAARRAPIGVIIPALFNDLSSPAMQHIIQELAGMNFVKRIYISLSRSSEEEFQRGREMIEPIKDHGVLLWNDAPVVQSVLEKIHQAVPLGARGKGAPCGPRWARRWAKAKSRLFRIFLRRVFQRRLQGW